MEVSTESPVVDDAVSPIAPAGAAPSPVGLRGRLSNLIAEIRANANGPPMDRRIVTIFLVTTVLLAVFQYFGRPEYFRKSHGDWADDVFGENWEYIKLVPYAYWAAASVVMRVLVPALLIWFVLKERLSDYGFRIRGTMRHLPHYLVLFAGVFPLVYLASRDASFLAKYPFYRGATQGGWHLWGFEVLYLIQFFSLECFFRGFLIFGLAKRFGYYAVLIMTIPYCMIHFTKPFPETLGAIITGILLGVLSLRSGSFLLGVILHFAVALSMDLLAIGGK